jgi:carbamoyl-phosphate synthase small subunit
MVTMTYPLIGNYGINPEDVESDRIQVAAFIIREYQPNPSNYRSTATLADYLQRLGIMGIEQIDTRALTRHIRRAGAMRAFISTRNLDSAYCIDRARQIPQMAGQDLARVVSTEQAYFWRNGKPDPVEMPMGEFTAELWHNSGRKPSIAAFDYGIKYNILRCLEQQGVEVLVLPAFTPASAVRALNPDGIFLSNGPGDPEPVTYAIDTIRELLGFRPMFGICLGHQLLGLALGGATFKLPFGHRGANQPVKNLLTGRIEITSQNHGFAVDLDSLPTDEIDITHVNLNDNTLEGFRHKTLPLIAVQYHPEASPGPHDANYLFEEFMQMVVGS